MITKNSTLLLIKQTPEIHKKMLKMVITHFQRNADRANSKQQTVL